MPPNNTTEAAAITPIWRMRPTIFSSRPSVQSVLFRTISKFPRQAVIDHFDSKCQDDQGENDTKQSSFSPKQDTGSQKRTYEHAQYNRHGQTGINVATAK